MFDKKKFKSQLVLAGISAKELAKKLGINESTLYRKINEDGRFTRKEINDMISILHIVDATEIFFAEKLS